jgi:multisubunit Na+/H+ antiporter MnhG subunit
MGQPGGGHQGPPPPPQQYPAEHQSGFGTVSAPPLGGAGQATDAKGFFSALFDWRFHTLITPKIVSIVYLIGMVLVGLYLLVFLMFSFTAGEPLLAVFALLVGPVAALIALAFWRMTLEFYVAVVRMSDDIHRSSGAPRP